MTRALFFIDGPHRLAGSQRSLLAALGRIDAFGIDPLVVFPAEGRCVDAYRAAGLAVRVVPGPPAYTTFGRRLFRLGLAGKARVVAGEVLPYCRTLARVIRDEDIDVVHFNTPRGILEAGLAARLARRKAVLHLRGTPGFGGPAWIAAQALATRIVPVARALLPSVMAPFRGRCRVVYNGVVLPPPRDRAAARAALAARRGIPLAGDEIVIVSLSSTSPFKGLHHLADAAAIARDRGVRARYVLAGSGEHDRYETWLRARWASRGLGDAVSFLGYVDDPLAVLAAADALVLPSVDRETIDPGDGGDPIVAQSNEGLPRAVLEAMSLGVPAIASRIAGVGEQIEDGVTGLIVPQADPPALAAAIVRIATDGALRDRMGARARQVVSERFTVDAAARGLAEVLQQTSRRSTKASA